MVADKKKLYLAMARACLNTTDLAQASGLPYNSVRNVIQGRGVRPKVLGTISKALNVDPLDIMKEEDHG